MVLDTFGYTIKSTRSAIFQPCVVIADLRSGGADATLTAVTSTTRRRKMAGDRMVMSMTAGNSMVAKQSMERAPRKSTFTMEKTSQDTTREEGQGTLGRLTDIVDTT